VFAYLGVEVKVDKNTNEMTFLQTGLIDKVLKATGMEDCNAKPTPAHTTALGTDADGPRCQLSWDYASVIGIKKNKKKTSALTCYLSMSLDYKEDPHRYDIFGAQGD